MKPILSIILLGTLFTFSGCKKDYTCMCSDPFIDNAGILIHATKKQAENQCTHMKNPFNDSKCVIMDKPTLFSL